MPGGNAFNRTRTTSRGQWQSPPYSKRQVASNPPTMSSRSQSKSVENEKSLENGFVVVGSETKSRERKRLDSKRCELAVEKYPLCSDVPRASSSCQPLSLQQDFGALQSEVSDTTTSLEQSGMEMNTLADNRQSLTFLRRSGSQNGIETLSKMFSNTLGQRLIEGEKLPPDVYDTILGHLPMRDVFQTRLVSRYFNSVLERGTFLRYRAISEGTFSPIFFTTDESGWHWSGFDTNSNEWTRLPTLACLPSPDPGVFKDFLIAGDAGLLCVNVGKAPNPEKLIVCNPLTKAVKELPPLTHPRHPVLMHLKVDEVGNYKVVVAGSSTIGTEQLSLITEEYESTTGKWTVTGALPCAEFGLNEYQNGAYYKDTEKELLLCVAVLDRGSKGVLVFDLKKKKWLRDRERRIPLVRPIAANTNQIAATHQILKCGESIYVFTEQECGKDVYSCLHKLKMDADMHESMWVEVMKHKRNGSRGLLVYPEFTCVPVRRHNLCIFNTLEITMEVFNSEKPSDAPEVYPAPNQIRGKRFHTLNPPGFVFRPNFQMKV